MNFQDESIDRRSFFKSFRTSLFTSAVAILAVHNEQTECRTDYSVKRVPIRKELLNNTRIQLSQELVVQLGKHFDTCVSFDETCKRCQGCVAICPTGALKTEAEDETPSFDHLLCSGCGLCSEFCLYEAVRIY